MNDHVRAFFFPTLTRKFLFRAGCLALVTFLVGKFLVRPVVIDGASMEPTYARHGFNFCWLPAYRKNLPARGDVVVLRYGGERWLLLKRVLAFAGETVAFRNGVCFIDGQALDEPYVVKSCDWNVPPRTVGKGHIYVMGDNRSVPVENHVGGEISRSRLEGRLLW